MFQVTTSLPAHNEPISKIKCFEYEGEELEEEKEEPAKKQKKQKKKKDEPEAEAVPEPVKEIIPLD